MDRTTKIEYEHRWNPINTKAIKVGNHETGVKVLVMHFSHNGNYLYKNNFESTFENFKTTLAIWYSALLKLYERIEYTIAEKNEKNIIPSD